MKNTRLLQLLHSFSKTEQNACLRFMQSPYFNQRKDVVSLFKYLVNCLFNLKSVPTKIQLFERIYPEEVYNDQRLRTLMSISFKLMEDFLVIESFKKDNEIIKKKCLVNIYRSRNIDTFFDKSLVNARRVNETRSIRNASFFMNGFYLGLEEHLHQTLGQRTTNFDLQTSSNNLDIAYASFKLRQACLIISHKSVYKTEYQSGFLQEVLDFIPKSDWLKIPAIAIYYYGYQLFLDKDNAALFLQFKSLLFAHADDFSKEEIRELYLLGVNFCLKAYNEGNRAFMPDLLDLYQQGLERKHLITNGILSRFTYRNIVTLGLIQKEYQWVQDFISSYQKKLEKKYQDSMYSFCKARLAYHLGNYGEALILLQRSDHEDHLLSLSAKTVMLKIYYETEAYDLLDAHLDAMKIYIRRKKIMAYLKENYSNLIKMMETILKLPVLDKKKRDVLQSLIVNTKAIAERDWLLKCL